MAQSRFKAFDVLPGAVSVWLVKEDGYKLTLLEANLAFEERFNIEDVTEQYGNTLQQVLPHLSVPAFDVALNHAIERQTEENTRIILPPGGTWDIDIAPFENEYIVLYMTPHMDENQPKTPSTPSTPPSQRSKSSLRTPQRSIASDMSLTASPLKSEKIPRFQNSPHTSNRKARAVFRQIDSGTPLKNARKELGEVLPGLVAENNSDAVAHALQHGANPDGENTSFTPLYAAIRMGNAQMVKQLLSEGASLGKWNSLGEYSKEQTFCPLKLAVEMDAESEIYKTMMEHFQFFEAMRMDQRRREGDDVEEQSAKRVKTTE